MNDPTFLDLSATRYLVPLKEGGSLPAIVDTESRVAQADQETGLFVVKFRGAGQGVKALVAELVLGGLADALGFRVPRLATVDLDEAFGRSEGDPEIQDILRGSRGINVGLRYLEGALNFDATHLDQIDAEFASRLVWFDALTFQIDRSARNPNLLLTPGEPGAEDAVWLIDHGAGLFPHHDWAGFTTARAEDPFPLIQNHVLLSRATALEHVDVTMAKQALAALDAVLDALPDDLLDHLIADDPAAEGSPDDVRARYRAFLAHRLGGPGAQGARPFVAPLIEAVGTARENPS